MEGTFQEVTSDGIRQQFQDFFCVRVGVVFALCQTNLRHEGSSADFILSRREPKLARKDHSSFMEADDERSFIAITISERVSLGPANGVDVLSN